MLVFLPAASSTTDVETAASVLRKAKIVVKTSVVVRARDEIVGGVLVLEFEDHIPRALDVLASAGIEAIT